ncbi:MAG: DNA polymerase III subunit epsilon [Rhodocyclaceae bacterium]|nr:DNA polymerase III subunit epsilon [Rhodocyclaceae bacterium]
MNSNARLGIAIVSAAVLFFVFSGAIGVLFWNDLSADEQQILLPLLTPRAGLLTAMVVTGGVVVALIIKTLFESYDVLPARLAETARLIVTTEPARRLALEGPGGVRELANVVNELAQHRESLQRDVQAQIQEGRRSVEEEKNRLAALMSELTQSVVVCNLDGRILLYNNRARMQFRAMSDAPAVAGGGELIGLGRSIYTVFDRGLIAHAIESLQHGMRRSSSQPVAHFVTTTRAGQLIRVQMAPVMSAREDKQEQTLTGFILMLDNITRTFEAESQRDLLLHSATEGNRAALANVRAAVEMLDYDDLEPAMRERFIGIIKDEVQGMSVRLDEAATTFASTLKTRWPLEEMLGADFVNAARRRIEEKVGLPVKLEDVDESVWLQLDSFSLLQALTYLASRLSDEFEVREVRLRLAAAERMAHLDLIWSGQAMSTETVMAWELEPMQIGSESSPLTIRDVVERHDGEMWLEREKTRHRAFFRVLLPKAQPQEQPEAETFLRGESRPEYYDFDLFKASEHEHALDDRLLSELTFTVFDTETTGLNPSQGDEIIQVGATRIVNGKLLKSESFEQLVDPKRPLAPESAEIHGITEVMLAGQPDIKAVLPAFHAFAADTVLVAHNAAFDMRFLQLKEEATGLRFDQPVLDTLLLSPLIHPNQESHRLEAIAERMGVHIMGRHTALGDAIVTGEVFLKMLPLLAEKGIRTLREAREAAEKTYYARVKY